MTLRAPRHAVADGLHIHKGVVRHAAPQPLLASGQRADGQGAQGGLLVTTKAIDRPLMRRPMDTGISLGQEYARRLTRRFSYMILSAHSFDLHTGEVLFHFEREIPIQNTCALLPATQKFLFLDSQKFTGEGEIGYSLRDLLATSNAVAVYTVSSDRSDQIKAAFKSLAARLLMPEPSPDGIDEEKTLRLTIVGRQGAATEPGIPYHGFLVGRDSNGQKGAR